MEKVKKEKFKDAFIYYLVLLAINLIISLIFYPLYREDFRKLPLIGKLDNFGVTFFGIIAIAMFFVDGAWLHLWACILCAKGNLFQTYKIKAYALTPMLLFSWLGFLNWLFTYIFIFWYAFFLIIRIKKLHKMGLLNSFLAWFISTFIVFILLTLFLIGFFMLTFEKYFPNLLKFL